ncbi:MAG TPA: PhnD/SsuA/transferrin family substrate-binding protein [Planctomycetota bacterium]
MPVDAARAGELRLLTYLAPGLPLALFRTCADALGRALGLRARLASERSRSAPAPGEPDPFRAGTADLGFLCAPGYLWLAETEPPAVALVPAAFVFDDPRARGRPVYFADLVVRAGAPARTLADLRGARWAYNDPCSLSGYFSVLAELERRGAGPDFFASAQAVGSHHAALAAVEEGAADCAAIDSNTLLAARRSGRLRGLRVLASFGPYPVQPIVARTGLGPERVRTVAATLLALHTEPAARARLARCGVLRLAPISPADYEPERAPLARAVAVGCSAAPRPWG